MYDFVKIINYLIKNRIILLFVFISCFSVKISNVKNSFYNKSLPTIVYGFYNNEWAREFGWYRIGSRTPTPRAEFVPVYLLTFSFLILQA